MDDTLAYYSRPAPMTGVGPHREAALSTDVAVLCGEIQGWLMHPAHAWRYGISVRESGEQELQARSVGQMLDQILAVDGRPLSQHRPPDRRAIGNCRHFATLLTGLLRSRGVPARARCGFGAYFETDRLVDHWVCELWDTVRGRWVLVDSQIDDVQRAGMGIDFDTLDLDREQFWVAGQAWLRCRDGTRDPQHFGIFDMWGLWFVRDNLLRDIAALCKVELLPWDAFGQMAREVRALDEEELALLDQIARLTTQDPVDATALRDLVAREPSLQVPETILSYRPEPGPVRLGRLHLG